MYRHRLLALMVGAVALMPIPKAINADVLFNRQIPFSGVFDNPCPPGNPLSVSGTSHLVIHLTTNANIEQYDLSVNTDNVEAVDTVTGTVYSVHQNGQKCPACSADLGQFKGSGGFKGPRVEVTVNNIETFESHGSEPNILIKFKDHITINANGDVKINFDYSSLTCPGT